MNIYDLFPFVECLTLKSIKHLQALMADFQVLQYEVSFTEYEHYKKSHPSVPQPLLHLRPCTRSSARLID